MSYKTEMNMERKGRGRYRRRRRNVKIKYVRKEERINEIKHGEKNKEAEIDMK